MNKTLIAKRFSKAVDTYDDEASVQQGIARKMATLLDEHVEVVPNPSILEVGCGTGSFSRLLLERFNPCRTVLNDICPEVRDCLKDLLNDRITFFGADAESCSFNGGQNLITSCSAIQWFGSPESFFDHCHRLLADNGYLAFSTFGKENMKEVSFVTGSSLPYRSKEELEQALEGKFELIYSEEEKIELSFDSPMQVLYHLKRTGVTAVKGEMWTKGRLTSFCRTYNENFSDDNSTVSLTYHPIYIIVKKK